MSEVRNTDGPDRGAVWHYGDPLGEQRRLEAGQASVDLSHRPVFTISGPDRLTWLHAVTSQEFWKINPGERTTAFVLDPRGRVEHVFCGADDGQRFWADTEPGHLEPLLEYLRRMVFASQVVISDGLHEWGLVLRGGEVRRVPRAHLADALGAVRAGTWASEALRIASGVPRVFVDTDDRTIPNELANPVGDRLGEAVHLRKGCYRGQETVARVHTLGRPPRRLTLLHLDGSAERLPQVGDQVMWGDRVVGRMGSAAVHHELGAIGLALLQRNTGVDEPLTVAGVAASQEVLVDPEVGLHVRPKLR